ncbi:MAG TPA: acyl-CoA synthetase FdrA [Halanaerobiales bacterium]|nr:acyl-CoA synthetase FdrA [Halanaerobiales bacterium]
MAKKALVKEGTYFDSVTLMSISKDIKGFDGVNEATIVMGTDANKEILNTAGLLVPEAEAAKPNDLVIVIDGEEEVLDEAIEKTNEMLAEQKASSDEEEEYNPGSLDGALDAQPDSNLVIISVPGEYAAREARKALKRGLHVMLFSDNVPVEDEIELKEMATEKGLLLMGPDCGTSIINGAPLAFSNVVSRGPVGIVAASGTGAQAVSTLVDRQGVGLTQVIGTGGRDLKSKVKGIEMIKDMKALDRDEDTEVIVLVSKPPAKEVSEKIMEEVKKLSKPVIVNFLGGDPSVVEGTDAIWTDTLEDAAMKAAAFIKGEEEVSATGLTEEEVAEIAEEETAQMSDEQKYLRGLYTGGTLCSEAVILLSEKYGDMYSNIPLKDELALKEDLKSIENTVIDLGEDEFTRGKPHPMIEPSLRNDRLLKEAEDKEIAVVLLDVVLGYGSHMDPAGEVAKAIKEAKEKVAERGGYLSVIASVCGTEKDPQNLQAQEEKLRQVGAKVLPTNVQAVRVVSKILSDLN